MSAGSYILLLLGMGLVTYLPRWLPLAVLSGRRLPPWLTDWLDLIPAAILSALVAPILFTGGSPPAFSLARPELFAAVPTLAVAVLTRSLGGTVVTGMLVYWLLGNLL